MRAGRAPQPALEQEPPEQQPRPPQAAAAEAAEQAAAGQAQKDAPAGARPQTTRRRDRPRRRTTDPQDGAAPTPTPARRTPAGDQVRRPRPAIAFARAQLGEPYRWGAAGPAPGTAPA